MGRLLEQIVGDVDLLKDGEMKEVPFHQRKVLLSRISGKYFATSHLCTHYKINLVKGVLTGDGRLICPWHGACFHVQTGDLEDPPGIDGLLKFQTRIENRNIIVSIDENRLTENNSEAHSCPTINTSSCVLIIGGGPGGFSAAASLRHEGFNGRIVLVSKESHLPIDRVKLSKEFGMPVDKLLLKNQTYYDDLKIEVILDTSVTNLDIKQNVALLSNGSSISFDYVVIAVGSVARGLPIPGFDGQNVFLIRDYKDSLNIAEALKTITRPKIVCIGSSFIGMECASALLKNSDKITVIGMESIAFERILGKEVGQSIQDLHSGKGVEFCMQSTVKQIELTKDNKVKAVILMNDQRIEADIVIVGVGARPYTDFLKSTNGEIAIEKDGSIMVNKHMQMDAYHHVFVVGDIARMPYEEEYIRVEHWNVAQQQGRLAGKNICKLIRQQKDSLLEYETVPFFWTMQFGKSFRYCGHASSFDQVHIDGQLSDLNYLAYYGRKGKVVAVLSIGRDPAAAKAVALMKAKAMPSMEDFIGGKSLMDVVIPDSASFKSEHVEESSQNVSSAGGYRCIIL